MIGIGVGSVIAIGEFVVDGVVRIIGAVRGKPKQAAAPGPQTQPLTYKDIEHIRAQERASIEASKRAAAAGRAKPPPRKGRP